MKTTEVFIEQVIIGCLVLLVCFLLAASSKTITISQSTDRLALVFQNEGSKSDRDLTVDSHKAKEPQETKGGEANPKNEDINEKKKEDTILINILFANISIGLLIIGAAYLIGIVYDRCADTLFQDLERKCRLNYALSGKDNLFQLFNDPFPEFKDPFPEHKYRMAVFKSWRALDHERYLRTRLRLTRSLSTLVPVIAMAIIIKNSGFNNPYLNALWVPITYLVAFCVINIPNRITPPKTNQIASVISYWLRKKCKGNFKFTCNCLSDRIHWTFFMSIILLCIGLQLRKECDCFLQANLILACTGIVLTIIMTWSWWRIYETYFGFIKDFYTSEDKPQEENIPPESTSLEMRWFFEEKILKNDEDVFIEASGGIKPNSTTVSDIYLIYSYPETIGVKFRNNELQVKTMVNNKIKENIFKGIKCNIERWNKRSYDINVKDDFIDNKAGRNVHWLKVEKNRNIRKFSADRGFEEVDAFKAHRIRAGCNVELTKFAIDHKIFYSLAFDAFSAGRDDLEYILKKTAEKFPEKYGAIENHLSKGQQMSFPDFLRAKIGCRVAFMTK